MDVAVSVTAFSDQQGLFQTQHSFFTPYDSVAWNVFPRDLPPSWKNPLGTNSLGQDIFWKATVAIRNSILLGLVAALISRTIAILIGPYFLLTLKLFERGRKNE